MSPAKGAPSAPSPSKEPLHPLVQAASDGRLPPWAVVSRQRRAHMERVSDLLDAWGRRAGLPSRERRRRRSLGYLHDSLKEAPEETLRKEVPAPWSAFPGPLLHGPAAAERLAREGVEDEELLDAVRHHTLGHPGLGTAGRWLYAADFLEPGRRLRNKWRAGLRERMPSDLDLVVREILAARITHQVERGRPVHGQTIAFWNRMTGGDAWARASEV